METRDTLAATVAGRGAHITFGQAIEGFPAERSGERVDGVPHTAWTLVWHMREVIQDIIDYVENPAGYASKPYPSGYWPESYAPPSPQAWQEAVEGVESALDRVVEWVTDESRPLFEVLPHTPGHTIFRQALLVADHTSYHIGQIVDLRLLMGIPVKDW